MRPQEHTRREPISWRRTRAATQADALPAVASAMPRAASHAPPADAPRRAHDAPLHRMLCAPTARRRVWKKQSPHWPADAMRAQPSSHATWNHAAPAASAREGGSSSMRVCCLTSIGADSSCVNLQSRRKQRPFCETCKPAGQQRGRVGNARGRREENTESTRGGAEVGGGLGDSR